MIKIWWKGEPLIVGSNRWRVIDNDLENTIRECIAQYKAATTIDEAVKYAHERGFEIKFTLVANPCSSGPIRG